MSLDHPHPINQYFTMTEEEKNVVTEELFKEYTSLFIDYSTKETFVESMGDLQLEFLLIHEESKLYEKYEVCEIYKRLLEKLDKYEYLIR